MFEALLWIGGVIAYFVVGGVVGYLTKFQHTKPVDMLVPAFLWPFKLLFEILDRVVLGIGYIALSGFVFARFVRERPTNDKR